jgi:hypothetical protein
MNQSSFIAGMLLTLFVLFLAANNRLSVYAGLLWGAGTAPSNPNAVGPSAANPAVAPGQSNTATNNFLNSIFGVPSSITNAVPNQGVGIQ